MKTNLPVTQKEELYPATFNILSTTNLEGKITHASADFVTVSGYSRAELLGQNHHLVRHPDMPSQVFASLWTALRGGRSWMGVIKNRCKNGSHWWVDAYVSP